MPWPTLAKRPASFSGGTSAAIGASLIAQTPWRTRARFKTGLRLLSSYPLKSGEVLWIITEAVDIEFGGKPTHRELTTLLLPADY